MIYLDNGATTLHKPQAVRAAVNRALLSCANPGRGGYPAAMEAAEAVFRCRSLAGTMFDCPPERVVFTMNCTHGLNMAIRTLVRPGDRVVISGFEHNAVTRPLHALGARVTVAGRKLFDWEDTLAAFDQALSEKPVAAIFTHVSNVFGYVLPVEQLAELCHLHGVPFLVDAAQSAGSRPVSLKKLGAEFIAMPGHKGLLGPQGTGLLLCARDPEPLMQGGTGSLSIQQDMPDFLPDRGEAGTVNVPGICGLAAGMAHIQRVGLKAIGAREAREMERAVRGLNRLGLRVFAGPHQAGVLSFLPPDGDCEKAAGSFAARGIALRAGLHCAPTAHESAGTLETGTVRASFGPDASPEQTRGFLQGAAAIWGRNKGPEGARS